MRLDFFMLADGASAPDGKVYIHGGAITRAYPAALPARMLLTGVTRLLVDPSELGAPPHVVSFEWSSPDEPKWTAVLRTDITVAEPPDGVREGEDIGVVIVAHMLIEFRVTGSHGVRVLLDGDEVCTRRLYIAPPDDPARPPATIVAESPTEAAQAESATE